MSRQIEMKFSYGEQAEAPRRVLPRDLLLEAIESRLDYTANIHDSGELFPQTTDGMSENSFNLDIK